MITIHELLEDPKFKEFFCTSPKMPDHLKNGKRWRLWVKIKGKWKKKNFATYVEMFKYFKKIRDKVQDAALTSPGYAFEPPNRVVRVKGKYKVGADGVKRQVTALTTWKPKLPIGEVEEHHWCPYCRRPTVFGYYTKHHAITARKLGGIGIDSSLMRCSICGSSENIVNLRKY